MSTLSWFKVCCCVCSPTVLFALDTVSPMWPLWKPLITFQHSPPSYPPQCPMTPYYHCAKAGPHRCNLKPTVGPISDIIYKMVMPPRTVQNTNLAISPFAIGCVRAWKSGSIIQVNVRFSEMQLERVVKAPISGNGTAHRCAQTQHRCRGEIMCNIIAPTHRAAACFDFFFFFFLLFFQPINGNIFA